MWNYRRNVERDLERWTGAGWVTPSGAAEIRKDLAKSPGIGLAGVLGILASVLLAFAVFSFVGANWDEIPRLARMVLLFGLMGLGYLIAGVFETRGKAALADAALLFSAAVFGASIALISQMYHIDGHAPDGVMLWWIGAFFAGVLLRSNPVLALAMVLVCASGRAWKWERAIVSSGRSSSAGRQWLRRSFGSVGGRVCIWRDWR